MEIPTGHVSPQSTATEAIPTYRYVDQSQKGDANQLEAMSHTQLTVILPSGQDCVAVYGSVCSAITTHVTMGHASVRR